MQNKEIINSIKRQDAHRKKLWKAAIKWPLYSVAIMPVLLAAGWKISIGSMVRCDQLIGFLLASILLLIWENLTNDLFDSETGVDEFKFHSVVTLLGEDGDSCITPYEWSEISGSIPWEILCGFKYRLPRVVI